MKTTLKTALAMTALAAALFTAPAFAEIDVDAAGVGFIGKGDVQDALGWNDHLLQTHAEDLTFAMVGTSTTRWTCTHNVNGNASPPRHRTVTGGGTLDIEIRRNPVGHVTGFFALGFVDGGATEASGHALWSCPGGPFTFDPNSVTHSGSTGALTVTFDGVSVPLGE